MTSSFIGLFQLHLPSQELVDEMLTQRNGMIAAAPTETSVFFPHPLSQDPLRPGMRNLLIPIALFGTLSLFTTVCFVGWITFRLCSWNRDCRPWIGHNQYIVLIYNLLIADVQQALCFFLSWYWYGENRIVAPHRACFAQGWLLSMGDVSSGFFVLFIAIHTYINIVQGKRMAYPTFVGMVIGIWAVSLLLGVLGPAIHGKRFYVDAGIWCWISMDYAPERLYLHYLWIFIDEFGTLAIYIAVFLFLRKRIRSMPDSQTNYKVETASRSMILYPTIYVLLTLPLAAGRMASLSGINVPSSYLAVAACAMTSCGWLDCVTYTITRRSLIATQLRPRHHLSRVFWKDSNGGNGTFSVTITGGKELRDLESTQKSIPPERPLRSNQWMDGWTPRTDLKSVNLSGHVSPSFGGSTSPVPMELPELPPSRSDITQRTQVEVTVTPAAEEENDAIDWIKL